MAATTESAAERRLPKNRRRSRVPTVIQMEAVECGAAALAMILAYHGRNVPLQTLRDACQVSRDGTTALQMAKVARGYGMNAKGASKDLHELDTLATPFVAYWSFYHFVVVEGWDSTWVYINDPAMGPRRVSWDEMDSHFTGIAIDFEPPQGPRPDCLRRRFFAASISRRSFRTAFAFCLAALPCPAFPVRFQRRVCRSRAFLRLASFSRRVDNGAIGETPSVNGRSFSR